eukprot:444752_1
MSCGRPDMLQGNMERPIWPIQGEPSVLSRSIEWQVYTCRKKKLLGVMCFCVLESLQDVVKLGDFDVGKHEFVYEPKHVPSNMKSRGYFKMHVSFADGAGRQLWEHKRRFRILKKSEGVVLQRCEHLLECNGKKSLSSSTSSVQLP